jgi:hypothetical protein
MMMMSKRVSFSHINVAPYECPSPEEKLKRWFNSEDFCSFQDDRRACIKAARLTDGDIDQLDHSIYCIRGLEDKLSNERYKEKICKRTAVIRMILKIHQQQKQQQRPDAEYLKMISMMCSKMSRDQALDMARLDEQSIDRKRPRVDEGEQSPKRRALLTECGTHQWTAGSV